MFQQFSNREEELCLCLLFWSQSIFNQRACAASEVALTRRKYRCFLVQTTQIYTGSHISGVCLLRRHISSLSNHGNTLTAALSALEGTRNTLADTRWHPVITRWRSNDRPSCHKCKQPPSTSASQNRKHSCANVPFKNSGPLLLLQQEQTGCNK